MVQRKAADTTVPLDPGLYQVSLVTGVALLVLGVGGILLPKASSKMYGVPLTGPDEAEGAYVRATAVRDLSLGGMFLSFAALRDRRALGIAALFSSVVAVGDGTIALRHSPAPLRVLPLHWGSVVALWGFAYVLLRDGTLKSDL